jgi:histidyl-tRNA synthetase
MSKPSDSRVKARLPRGLVDRDAADIEAVERMCARIRDVYRRYGFEPVETPLIEYTEALGKFLPDQDRPNEGVFSFKDDDEQWLSLRYDLTAPLARYVAEHHDRLAKPYRSYRAGWVFRNEKPGPGRFRQFMQFDADTVGSGSPAADAEICMMAADTLEALGIPRGQYVIKVNNRKVLDGVMEAAGLGGAENAGRRLIVLRAIDKLDRLGVDGVRLLLGAGRKDESGDFTKGAGLSDAQAAIILASLSAEAARLHGTAGKAVDSESFRQGWAELAQIGDMVAAAGYGADRIQIDASIVRGLEYYTGPVFEAQLTFDVVNEDGQRMQFGSVGGGGRYDGLVSRFRPEPMPATGFSIGVSRLYAALKAINSPIIAGAAESGPVVVLAMDRERMGDYFAMAGELRAAGIRAEVYLGGAGMKAQMKYADRRGAPCVVIQGSDEFARGDVTLKDLIEGARQAAAMASHADYKAARPAQSSVARADLVAAVQRILQN